MVTIYLGLSHTVWKIWRDENNSVATANKYWLPIAMAIGNQYLLAVATELFSLPWQLGGVAQLVERRSLAGELSLSCARPAADG